MQSALLCTPQDTSQEINYLAPVCYSKTNLHGFDPKKTGSRLASLELQTVQKVPWSIFMFPSVSIVARSSALFGEPAIRVSISFQQKAVVSQLAGARWNHEAKVWDFPVNEFAAKNIIEALSHKEAKFSEPFRVKFMPEAPDMSHLWHKPELEGDLSPIPITKHTPWKHQLQAYHFLKDRNNGALFMDMGTGKTKVMIDLIQNRADMKRVLIICPKAVVPVWKDEVAKHAVNDLPVYTLNQASTTKKIAALQQWLGFTDSKAVFVLNYDSAWRPEMSKALIEAKFETVILDESHRAKGHNTSISKFLSRLGKATPKRFLLTGTPMPHDPLDIFSQFRFMDTSIFGSNFTAFSSQYAIMQPLAGNARVKVVVAFRNLDELTKRIYHSAFRVTKDVLDLPDTVENTYYFDLPKESQKIYNQINDQLTLDLRSIQESHDPKGLENALVKVIKLQQVLSGFAKDGDTTVTLDYAGKAQLCRNIVLESSQQKFVVFTLFHKSIINLRYAFAQGKHDNKPEMYELSGRCPITQGEVQKWKDSPAKSVLLVQIQSGGVGIDLTAASTAFYYDLTYNLGNYGQSKARIHRPGQANTCNYIQMLATPFPIHGKGPDELPLDSKILDVLRNRKSFIESVLKNPAPVQTIEAVTPLEQAYDKIDNGLSRAVKQRGQY